MQQHWEIIEQLTEKTWGTRLNCFVGVQNDGTFNSFHEEEIGELLAKYTARTTTIRRTTSANWRIYICSVLNNSLSPKLADKQAIEDELSIDGRKAFGFGTYTQPHSIIANYDVENFIGQLRDGECFSLQFSCAN